MYNNKPVTCKVDNQGVSCLLKQNFTNNKQARWASFLQQFDIRLEFLKGDKNVVADALSRQWPDIDSLDKIDREVVDECNTMFQLDICAEDLVDNTTESKLECPNFEFNDEERGLWLTAYRDDHDFGPLVRHFVDGVNLVKKPIAARGDFQWHYTHLLLPYLTYLVSQYQAIAC